MKIYLRDPETLPDFVKLSKLEISPGSFVNFSDFCSYNLASCFEQAGLYDLFSVENKIFYCPSLATMFYANLTLTTNARTNSSMISTLVKGKEIKLSPKAIGKCNLQFRCTYLSTSTRYGENT